jgi:tRNA modification GTPase
LLNKNDLPEHADWAGVDALRISCVADDGLRGLEDQILARVSRDHVVAESAAAINARHRDCLQRALDACDRARATMQQELAPEYVAVDLRAALRAVGEVTGADDIEEILDSVFAQFCIGK